MPEDYLGVPVIHGSGCSVAVAQCLLGLLEVCDVGVQEENRKPLQGEPCRGVGGAVVIGGCSGGLCGCIPYGYDRCSADAVVPRHLRHGDPLIQSCPDGVALLFSGLGGSA